MKEIVSLLSLKVNRSYEERFPDITENDPEMISKIGCDVNGQGKTDKKGPSLVSFSVLVANFQDFVRICAELPPEESFSLIQQILKGMEGTFNKYNGIHGKHIGEGMVCYFLKNTDSNYLMNAILCAFELRENMLKLSNEWRISKGWFNDLFMNIGINEGQEYFESIPELTAIGLMAFGDSVTHAERLSNIASNGSIWTTKSLMIRLCQEERKKILYGICRKQQDREILIENVYSRVMDLVPPECLKSNKLMDIASLSATEIFKIR